MGNENLNADLIYEFWRWEYLRRNVEYQKHYDSLATYLNELGVTAFKELSVEDFKNHKVSILDCLVTDKDFAEENSLDILSTLWLSINKFKIFPILHPNSGIESKELLEKIILNESKNISVDYNLLPKANLITSLFSSIIKKEDIAPPSPPLPNAIAKAHERFLSQNPSSDTLNQYLDQAIESIDKNSFEKGKYQILKGVGDSEITKDRKKLIAFDELIDSDGKIEKLTNAVRNQKQQWLKDNDLRIKQKNFSRAVGLYLWDEKNQHGKMDKIVIDAFYKQLIEIEEKYNLPETNSFMLDQGKGLRKLVRNTNKCIQQIDLLPIT